ncbi:MAG: alpha-galactosidase [Verrucomicrobia bacterium]|nr:alpha-galactosidase [Verrucomicrobiota bacterium]
MRRCARGAWLIAPFLGLLVRLGAAEATPSSGKFIAITTHRSALVFFADQTGVLYQRSFGRIPVTPGKSLPDSTRYEEALPCYGSGYLLEPALQVVHADGNTSTELRYVAHESSAESANVSVTRIHLRDRYYDFFVDLCFRTYAAEDVIEQWTEISNRESAPVTLGRFASAAPKFQASSYWVSQFYGDVLREGELVEERLAPGLKILDSKLTVRAHLNRNPSFMLSLDGPAQEETGEVIGGTLAWSGNFSFGFDVDSDARLRVLAGISPLGAERRLQPGKTFVTPAMLWSWSAAGKGQVSRNFHRWARRYGIRDGDKPRPVLLNNWETTFFDFNETKLLALFDGARDLGIDLFLLDDGWFSDKDPKNHERIGLGDWQTNPRILPHGLSFLADQAHQRGFGFGIWMEPESVHLGSKLYRDHPDWIMRQPHRELQAPNTQLLLDLTRPETRDYVWKAIDRVLGENPGITYLKWDANRVAPQPGSSFLPADEQQHLPVDYQRALYEIMQRMKEKYPNVTAMLCAGGGGRVDYAALKYFHSFWPSDSTDPLQRIYIQWGYSHLFPAWALSSHITSMGHRPMKFSIDVAFTGALGIDRDVAKMSEDDHVALKQGVRVYREHVRDLVQHGDLYRLESPYDNKRAVLSYIAEDRTRALVFLYQLRETAMGPVKLRGLDPTRLYRAHELNLPRGEKSRLAIEDRVVGGDELMTTGFASPLRRAIESAVIEFTTEAK